MKKYTNPITKPVTLDVGHCARCGKNHTQIEFTPFNHEVYTHWALCPEKNAPILMTMMLEDAPVLGLG